MDKRTHGYMLAFRNRIETIVYKHKNDEKMIKRLIAKEHKKLRALLNDARKDN